MIRLIGPGAAGKTTVGHALARRLEFSFIDLDEQFRVRFGDISVYLDSHEYSCYAKRNVQLYLDSLDDAPRCAVLALSSGFMTYNDPHPAYERVYRDILASSSTLVLLPSFDYETCVAETVRRQLERPFSRSAKREEEVIRTRFKVFWSMPVKKCATNKPFDGVVQDLLAQLLPVIEDRQLAPYLNKPDCWP